MNAGKVFEKDWKDSVPHDVYYYRLNDPAQAFSPTQTMRFAPHNPYDCMLFMSPVLHTLELKSTQSTSISFWREDFANTKTAMIKKWQINGLLTASAYSGVVAGFILNFRTTEHTYFLEINMFKEFTDNHPRKSINEKDVLNAGGVLIGQTILKTHYRYDIRGLLDVTARYSSGGNIGETDIARH